MYCNKNKNEKNNLQLKENPSVNIWRLPLMTLVALTLLGGCTSYQPQSLPEQNLLEQNLDLLSSKANQLIGQQSGRHEINLDDGLDLTEVAILAVLGNPDLKSKRTQVHVAGAQAFAAGLLPDPQLAANLDQPVRSSVGLMNGWGLGLGYDIIPLITRQARVDAEQSTQARINLEVLWQEWQVIQQARSLAVRYQLEQQRLSLLIKMRDLYQGRYQHSAKGLAQGDITLDVNGTDLTAVLDSLSLTSQLEQTHNQTRYALTLLLGLQPETKIPLAKLPIAIPLDRSVIPLQLEKLSTVRPDLLALQAGYESQEARVRAAILAQFPSFSIGITRARDTGGLYTNGFNIGLNLPLFSGNRGAIAIERATRVQLSQEYQARLAQTQTDIKRLLDLQTIIEQQRNDLQIYLPHLQVLVKRARSAYRRGDIDALTFLNMESTWVNKRLELISLQQSQWENWLALQTLLAMPDNDLSNVSKS